MAETKRRHANDGRKEKKKAKGKKRTIKALFTGRGKGGKGRTHYSPFFTKERGGGRGKIGGGRKPPQGQCQVAERGGGVRFVEKKKKKSSRKKKKRKESKELTDSLGREKGGKTPLGETSPRPEEKEWNKGGGFLLEKRKGFLLDVETFFLPPFFGKKRETGAGCTFPCFGQRGRGKKRESSLQHRGERGEES